MKAEVLAKAYCKVSVCDDHSIWHLCQYKSRKC